MKELLIKYNAQVPRYTSYPTAPHFTPMTGDDYGAQLQALPLDNPLSLYFHIPFCKEMCWYCGCHTTATRKYAPVEDYVTLLLRELRLVAEKLHPLPKIGHIHFGGGSPSMLSPDDMGRIFEGIHRHFSINPDAEIALEADPRGITHDRAETYQKCGFNRASFGIQDFSPAVQKAINRVQDFDTVRKAVDLMRSHGVTAVNFDLMYGLPLQTINDIQDSVEKSLALSPSRIALFGYAHVPWMKKHMRLIKDEDLPDAAARIDLFTKAEELLCSAGLVPVGIDHFARADDDMLKAAQQKKLGRNFQGYTTDTAETLLGIGVSSIGKMPGGFAQNAANITEYTADILDGRLPTRRGYILQDDDLLRGGIISDLMCYLEADIAGALSAHGKSPEEFDGILAQLQPLQEDGLIDIQNRKITIPQAARQIARVVAAAFDSQFGKGNARHSQAA